MFSETMVSSGKLSSVGPKSSHLFILYCRLIPIDFNYQIIYSQANRLQVYINLKSFVVAAHFGWIRFSIFKHQPYNFTFWPKSTIQVVIGPTKIYNGGLVVGQNQSFAKKKNNRASELLLHGEEMLGLLWNSTGLTLFCS